eukprot:gene13947-16964_t
MFSAGGPVTASLDGRATTAHRLFIPSRMPHAILQTHGEVLMVYAEPGAFDFDSLQAALADSERSLEALERTLRQLPRRALEDARVERALSALDQQLSGKLERLFANQLGLPVRRLVLWRRLRVALGLALGGSTLTEAAHGAGFADSAHFSRTMKQLFGVTAGASLRNLHVRILD